MEWMPNIHFIFALCVSFNHPTFSRGEALPKYTLFLQSSISFKVRAILASFIDYRMERLLSGSGFACEERQRFQLAFLDKWQYLN
jgi:hypothetical protein